MKITIREMTANDAQEVNMLSGQLGYPLPLDQTIQNIRSVLKSKDHIAFVAVDEGKVIGWIGAAQAFMIEVLPHCEINGLVIDENYRGKGIGKMLIEKLKQWALQKGNEIMSLHCNVKRSSAHLFYEHLGFKEIKEQKNFVIRI